MSGTSAWGNKLKKNPNQPDHQPKITNQQKKNQPKNSTNLPPNPKTWLTKPKYFYNIALTIASL